ncbi:hypothetical protein INT43_008841 [Umbelopsis isabellina]|uniref:GATA-type domain-containing protein n=1 Tax=Mortierella isabellina TaxID=91625 RepID=A0A8H7PWS7_MORIS|nr:hypothetical protein INT43_008841 [Umbelopsis isabellina]
MKISSLLAGPTLSPSPCSCISVHDLATVYKERLHKSGFNVVADLNPMKNASITFDISTSKLPKTTMYIKTASYNKLGKAYRCQFSSGKSRLPIKSSQLGSQMKMVNIFFNSSDQDQTILPQFLLFPSWLLHAFQFSKHGKNPGRTELRFFLDASDAKLDAVFRFNNILNILFRFDIDNIDRNQIENVIRLSNHLAKMCSNRPLSPPPSRAPAGVHQLYADMIELLNQQRPNKMKPACANCLNKPSSRRSLCVACYRYQLKYNVPRPRNLISNRRTCKKISLPPKKQCVNCSVNTTHQWYRNTLGKGHWCETCRSYFVRNKALRPKKLFVKAAQRNLNLHTY